jgi:hypothetical protein
MAVAQTDRVGLTESLATAGFPLWGRPFDRPMALIRHCAPCNHPARCS